MLCGKIAGRFGLPMPTNQNNQMDGLTSRPPRKTDPMLA